MKPILTLVILPLSLATPIYFKLCLLPRGSLWNWIGANSINGEENLGSRLGFGSERSTSTDTNYTHPDQKEASGMASYVDALQKEQLVLSLRDRHSDDLLAAGLLLLVPISLGLVELAEHIARSLSTEEFPERGREKRRWKTLQEREEWILKRREREQKTTKCWRTRRRLSSLS